GFVPATDPRLAIIVMIDEPQGKHQGGSVAAPVFNLIAEAALGDYAIPPDDKAFRDSLAALSKKYESQSEDGESQDENPTSSSAVGSAPIEIKPAPPESRPNAASNAATGVRDDAIAQSDRSSKRKSEPPRSAGPSENISSLIRNLKAAPTATPSKLLPQNS